MTFQTFSGREYLKIDIANNFGLDKEDWDVRLAWFDDNESNLDALIKQAEEPALYYAGVQAWKKACKGQSSGYPISLDATSSGIQLLAALTGDRKAARLCNIVDTGHREDAYTGLYNTMLERIGEGAKISRKDTKSAIMTAFYASTAVPKRVFGEGALLETFFDVMETECPGPWEVTKTMLAIWNPEALHNSWVLPDNFHVKVKVMGNVTEYVHFLNEPFEVNYSVNKPIEGGRSLGANKLHSVDGMVVREMDRRCNHNADRITTISRWIKEARGGTSTSRDNDKIIMTLASHYRESGFLSARVLDYVDAANMGHLDRDALSSLVQSLPAKPFKVLSVHDCFRCLPNYGNDLRRQYNQIMSEIAKSDMLSFLVSQIVKRKVTVAKLDPDLWKDILEANYALS